MIKTFTQFLFALLFFVSCPVSMLMAQTPIWSDEFNGTSIDKSIWTYDVRGDGMGNGELEYNTDRPANSYTSGGNLVIKAIREEFGGNHFTSARLKTLGRFSFLYGTLEARIKLPNLKNGLWPAFWTMGTNIGQVGWPKCGEFDIMELGSESARLKDSLNQIVTAAAHWWHEAGTWSTWLQADASAPAALNGNFYDAYHTFKMVWDASHIEFWLDSKKYFDMKTSDPNMSEFRKPQFIILNLAVGGANYVNITDPNLITAALPAQMLVDYVRLYPIAGQTQVFYEKDNEKTGNFSIFSERANADSLKFSSDAHIFFWNNMTNVAGAAYEGASVLNCRMAAGDWFGMGILNDKNLNMTNYSDGYLRVAMKTTSTQTIGIGVSSANGESYVDLVDGGKQYGLVRDGLWHVVSIPLNLFAVDFTTIVQPFILKGDAPSAVTTISVDDIYWTPSGVRPTPSNGNFGIYTDNTVCSSKFVTGTNGDFYIWDKTLNSVATTASEGANVLSFTSAPGLAWFGAAFTPFVKYDLTAYRYASSKLHFDIKTTSTTTFKIGMKSGNTSNLNQTWINFANGADPYGLVRDGQWHGIDIPMSDFSNIDLSEVSQLFQLLGQDGSISNIALDNIYFSGGGAPIGTNVSVTGVTLTPSTASIAMGSTKQLTVSIAPSNATNSAVSYTTSNAAIATVSASGLITALAAGTATITVKTTDGNKTDVCAVTVTAANIAVTSVSLSPATTSIVKGATKQLTATIVPSNATNKSVTYTTSNAAVATVSASGLITAIAAGTATITVKTTDGNKTNVCAVTVTATAVAVTGVTLSPTTASIVKGATKQLTATIAPTTATNKAVTYTTSNAAIATVSASGLVTAVAVGTATITVNSTNGNFTATCVVTVTAASSTCQVTGQNSDYTLSLGNTANPTFTFTPGASIAGCTWVLMYPKINGVDQGAITMTKSGANFTYTATAAIGATITCYFTYSVPSTGGQNDNSANPHSVTVGTCSTLKTMDLNSTDINVSKQVVVYPNPIVGENVEIALVGFEGNSTIKLLNMAGVEVLNNNITVSENNTSVSLSVGTLPNGVYIVMVKNGSDLKFNKLMINR